MMTSPVASSRALAIPRRSASRLERTRCRQPGHTSGEHAATNARRLFGICQTGGRLDDAKLRTAIQGLVESKPRDYVGILAALQRLTRLDLERRKVTVESAVELDEATRQRVVREARQHMRTHADEPISVPDASNSGTMPFIPAGSNRRVRR